MSLISTVFLGALKFTFAISLSSMSARCAEGTEKYVEGKHSFVPASGFVPNKETAMKIAEAVWLPIYGKEVLDHEKPFEATLEGDLWHVEGFLPEGWKGGVAEIEINKSDGKVSRVSHGK